MEDEGAAEPEWEFPRGAPIRVYEWLTPPLIPIGLGLVLIFAPITRTWHIPPSLIAVAVSVVFAAALALWIFGYLAYRDLTDEAVERYFLVIAISVFAGGVLLSFGYIGFILLFGAGRLAALRKLRPLRLLRTIMPRRLWRRTAVISAIVAVVCLLLGPLARGLDFAPLIVVVIVGQIVGPLVFGFAIRFRGDARGIY